MFERQLKMLSWVCVWWIIATSATAQSNQPIDIGLSTDDQPVSPLPPETPGNQNDKRFVRLAKQLGTVEQTPRVPPSPTTPSIPRLPRNVRVPSSVKTVVDNEPSKQSLLSPTERIPLGTPKTTNDRQRVPNAPETHTSNWILNTATALGVVLGVIYLIRTVVVRFGTHAPAVTNASVLEVLTRINVAPRNHILLIRMGRRILAVGDSAAGLRTLANVDDPEEVADLIALAVANKPNSITRGFNQLLNRFNSDYTNQIKRVEEGNDTAESRVDRARDQVSNLMTRVRAMAQRGDAA